MTDYTCPVDGCDYGAEGGKSLAAMRAHINATKNDRHTWGDLKETVEQQADADESEDSLDSSNEASEVAASATEDDGDDGAADEYAEQLSAAARKPDAVEDPEEDGDDGGETGNPNSGPGLAVLAGTAALGLAVLLSRRGKGDGPTTTTEQETQSEETNEMKPTALR